MTQTRGWIVYESAEPEEPPFPIVDDAQRDARIEKPFTAIAFSVCNWWRLARGYNGNVYGLNLISILGYVERVFILEEDSESIEYIYY